MLSTFNSCTVFLRSILEAVPKKLIAFLVGAIMLFSNDDALAQNTSQTRRVSGQVTDIATGEALVGATLTVQGKATTVTSDGSGKFSIEAASNAVLIVTYTGFTDLEIPVDGKTVMDIKLARVTKDLDAVVVTGFGLTQKKATLSGAVSQISGEELSRSKQTSAAGALVGKVGGVNFRQTTGRPGATPEIRIRNFFGGNNPPLVVIDGTMRNIDAFNALDYNDIESVNILKDGSAAIYGFGAENGVIVVVTKKGKRGQKPTLSFDTYYGTQTYANFLKPGDVKSYIRGIVQTETYGDGRQSSPRTVTPEIYEKVMNGEPGYEGFDWYKYIYKSAPQYQAKLSVSGGTENSDYYISGSTLSQGVALRDFGDGFQRHNIQANFNTKISKRIRFGVQMNGYWSKESYTNVEGDDFGWQAEAPYRNVPIQIAPGSTTFLNPVSGPYLDGNPLYPMSSSPSSAAYSYGLVKPELSGTESTIRRNISINGNLEVDIIKGLKARMQANYSFLNNQFDSRRMAPSLYVNNPLLGIIADPAFVQQRNIDHVFTNTDNSSLQFQLEYQTSIGQHHIKAVASQQSQMNYAPSIRIQGIPPANNVPYLPNTALSFLTAFNDNISNNVPKQGYIVNLNYDYAGKYIFEAFGRYDGSSDYRPSVRWGFFPGGSVGYRISQEDFWKQSPILRIFNDFKIRASYGITPFETGENWLTGYNYSVGSGVINGTQITGSQIRQPGSTALSWGKAHHYDYGIDLSLLNSRLSITLDYFEKIRKGIPAPTGVTLPDLVGFQTGNENINSDKNRGIDGNVAWRDRTKGGISYGFNASFSYGRSIIGFRNNNIFGSDYDRFRGNFQGRLVGGPFQYQAIGQFQNWEQIQKHGIDQDGKGNVTVKPGDFIFKDVNGDGFINAQDQTRETYQINGGTPPLGFGFGFFVNYKGFEFRADFMGGSMYTFEQTSSGFNGSTGSAYMREWLPLRNTSQYLFDNSSYYSDPFDRNSPIIVGKYPLLLQTNPAPNTNFNHSGYQTNITYVKARNIEIGYTLPYTVLRSFGISQLKVYVSGNNVFNISNMPGNIDPELSIGAGGGLPNPRVLTVGAQVKF